MRRPKNSSLRDLAIERYADVLTAIDLNSKMEALFDAQALEALSRLPIRPPSPYLQARIEAAIREAVK